MAEMRIIETTTSDITNNDIPYIDPKIQTQDVMLLNYHLIQTVLFVLNHDELESNDYSIL